MSKGSNSNSLTPKLTRKKLKQTDFIKRYEYSRNEDDIEVVRFAIDIAKNNQEQIKQGSLDKVNLHQIEQDVFKCAYEHLENLKKLNQKVNNSTVLIDIFVRGKAKNIPGIYEFQIDKISENVEVHTLCLWDNNDKIILIDPSNTSFSSFLKECSVIKIDDVLTHNKNIDSNSYKLISKKDNPKQNLKKGNVTYIPAKFYESSLITKVGDKSGSRDCIDIAVKIAFTLKDINSNDYNDVIAAINKLSSQEKLNPILKNTGNDGTPILELQSSDPEKRIKAENAFKKLQEQIKNKELIEVFCNNLDDLKEVVSSDGTNKLIKENITLFEEFLGNDRIHYNKLPSIFKLIDALDSAYIKFNFPFHKIRLIPDASTKTKYSITDNNYTTKLHKAAEDGNFIKVESLLKKFKDDKNYVNLCDMYGQTALYYAIHSNNNNIVSIILECSNFETFVDLKDEMIHLLRYFEFYSRGMIQSTSPAILGEPSQKQPV